MNISSLIETWIFGKLKPKDQLKEIIYLLFCKVQQKVFMQSMEFFK